MNLIPLPDEKDQAMVAASRDVILSSKAWSVDPLGVSEFQMRYFVVKQGNPTPDAQYKQVILELWTRWGVYQTMTYDLAKTDAQIERWRGKWCVWQWQRMERKAELDALSARREDILLQMEHRLFRECRILMTILKELEPKEGDRNEVELDNFAQRAVSDPHVREFMTQQKLLGSRSK
jgi:hypothetical protein